MSSLYIIWGQVEKKNDKWKTILPLTGFSLCKPNIYNGWRHTLSLWRIRYKLCRHLVCYHSGTQGIGARSFSLQKRYLQNFFLQNISLQRLFLQEFFSTEVIPTQRLNLQHNIPTEFLSTLPSSYIPFFIQRLYLQENFSEKIYHKFLFQRTE